MVLNRKFELSPVFCLHNGVVVLEQSSELVKIGLLDDTDVNLKLRLEHAVESCCFLQDENNSINNKINVTVQFVKLLQEDFIKQMSMRITSAIDSVIKINDKLEEQKNDNEIAVLLDGLILRAKSLSATDIHIEEKQIRFRIEGQLYTQLSLLEGQSEGIIRRIKLLAKLNVVEKRHGQDGSFVFTCPDKTKIFVRVSCIPSVSTSYEDGSESIVLRLLDVNRVPLKLNLLGFTEEQIVDVQKLCSLSDGLVLIAGATGSGKSTTAGAMLEFINNTSLDKKKILSLEDPPEYVLPGVTQIKIESSYGMDFPEVLRRVFRQDPDIIFIGEIRDCITADIALKASLTGHLVIATVHVGSVTQTILRMNDLSKNPVLVKSVLKGVILQKLTNSIMTAQIQSFIGEMNV